MIDFTSALYLGIKHGSVELSAWQQLTTGVPAALGELSQSKPFSRQIAHMQGLQDGVVAPSTLHLYWDLYGFLSHRNVAVFIDDKVYPVAKYGIERLQVKGIPVHYFRHHDADHLFESITKKLKNFTIPYVFTDGWCPPCGKPAPIADYAKILSPFEGTVIVDDTQAFGIFGERKNSAIYGSGGGGILKWLNIQDDNIITIVSLAKAFGVPIAVISGRQGLITAFEKSSETRVNSSPVSSAHLTAGLHALSINHNSGDARRHKLWNNVSLVRKEFSKRGISLTGGIFAVQGISGQHADQIITLFNGLTRNGVRAVLTSGHTEKCPSISLIVRSDHSQNDIESLVASITIILKNANRYFRSPRRHKTP